MAIPSSSIHTCTCWSILLPLPLLLLLVVISGCHQFQLLSYLICVVVRPLTLTPTLLVRPHTVSMKVSFTLGSLLYSPSVYCCHLSFTSLSSVTTFPGLDFMAPHLALRDPVMCLISLKRSLVLPILLHSSICLHFSCIVCSFLCPSLLSSGKPHSIFYIFHRLLYFSLFFVHLRFSLLHRIAIL